MIDPRALASEQLSPGEHLVWAGSSDPRVLFTPRDAFLIPFSLLWCSFIAFWVTDAVTSGGDSVFLVVGTVFVLMGAHLLAGRFIVKRHRKTSEAYAVTDRRVFVTNGRTTRETQVGRSDRNVRWTNGRRRCSVEWETRNGAGAFFMGGGVAQIYANTGLDGFFGPRPMAFWDVTDGEALMRALDS